MPKKSHGRPAKPRSRPRRPVPGTNTASNGAVAVSPPPDATGPVSNSIAVASASPVPSPASTAAPAARPASSSRPRRTSNVGRLPGATINYAYLRRDMLMLAALAPSMVVVLIIAYIFLH